MSIKKLAKAINNVADAIRYHADTAAKAPAEYVAPSDIMANYEKARAAEYVGPSSKSLEVPPATTAEYVDPMGNEAARALEWAEPAEYVDPYDIPAVVKEVPGWQTLTVAELDAAPKPVDNPAPKPVDNPAQASATPAPAPAPPAPKPVDNPAPKPVDNPDPKPVDNSVDLDANGLPWDERIHSGGRTKLADGTWRDKRNVPDAEREAVVAEITTVMAIPTPEPAAPGADGIATLPEFVRALTAAKIEADTVKAAVQSVGLENITQLGARPDLIQAVAAELGL